MIARDAGDIGKAGTVKRKKVDRVETHDGKLCVGTPLTSTVTSACPKSAHVPAAVNGSGSGGGAGFILGSFFFPSVFPWHSEARIAS